MEGKKLDQDKPRVDLVNPEFILGVADVLTFGAKKYEPNNWQKVRDAQNRYYAAAQRHMLAWRKGEHIDPESGLNHLYHAACNMMFLSWFDKEQDNG